MRVTWKQVAGGAVDRDQRDTFVVEPVQHQWVEVELRLATAEQADYGDPAAIPDDLYGRPVGRPGIRSEDHQVDADAVGELVQPGLQIGIVGPIGRVGTHLHRHLHADGAVRQANYPTPEERAQRHGTQSEDSQSDYGDVLARREIGLAIAQATEGIEVGPHGVLGLHLVGDLRDMSALIVYVPGAVT